MKLADHATMRKLYRLEGERWYISFNTKGSYDPVNGKWMKSVWPILFHSEEAARLVVEKFPVFANKEEMPGRGRIKSCCVERLLLKERR